MIAKWTQVIASVVLVLVSAALLLRDWKFHDKRTKTHSVFTVLMLVVSVLAACAMGWSMWKTFPEPEPQPAFSFYLNGKPMENGAVLPVVVTNRSQALVVAVQNHGTANAERLFVHAVGPKEVIQPAAGWSEQPAGFDTVGGELRSRSGLGHFQIEAAGLIDPSCFFVCPAFSIGENVVMPCTFQFAVVASAKGRARDAVLLTLSVSSGAGSAQK
jgi:hypothetical protein